MTAMTWQAVQAEALRRIRTREWPPGARIPAEEDLARELGCARTTVNRALRDLAEAGLLDRRRRAGTHVATTPVRKATFEIPIIRQDVEARGLVHGYTLLTRAMAPPDAATCTALALPGDVPLLRVVALHLAGGAPFCLEDRWINPVAAPGVEQADLSVTSANEWLVRHTAFSGGGIEFGAVAADAVQAAHLACAPGAALFEIVRTTWAGADPITAVRLTYAPGYRMKTAL